MKNIAKTLIFSLAVFTLVTTPALAYNEKVACPNDICTAITDDLPDRAIGINPNQKVDLGFGVYHKITQQAPTCEGTRKLFHAVRHYKDRVLYNDMTKNNYEYLNQGEDNVFTYEFNSGPTGQLNRYQGVFYCWTSAQGTNRGVIDLLLGNLGTQNQTWSTPLFDQTTRVAQRSPTLTPTSTPGTGNRNKTTSLEFSNPLAAETFTELIQSIQTWLFYLAMPIAVIMIVVSGIIMMASGGDPGRFGKAKKMLLWAIVGLAMILIGEGFFKLIESIINLKNR